MTYANSKLAVKEQNVVQLNREPVSILYENDVGAAVNANWAMSDNLTISVPIFRRSIIPHPGNRQFTIRTTGVATHTGPPKPANQKKLSNEIERIRTTYTHIRTTYPHISVIIRASAYTLYENRYGHLGNELHRELTNRRYIVFEINMNKNT